MKQEIFCRNNFVDMQAMHDSVIKEIKIEKNVLIICYENLNELAQIYEYNNLTIKYFFETYCDARVFGKRKYKDMNACDFFKKHKDYVYKSFKKSVDNFCEITLEISVAKLKNNKIKKWYALYLTLDPIKVIYDWSNL